MPKLPRSRSLKPMSVTKPVFRPVQQEEIWWHVTEVPRFWCPACGMCANETQLDDAPYRVLVGVQKFGGRLADGRPYFPDYKPTDGDGDPKQLLETLYRLREVLPQAMAQVEEQIAEYEGASSTGGYRAAPQFERPTLPEWEEEEQEFYEPGPFAAEIEAPQRPKRPKRVKSKPETQALPVPRPRGERKRQPRSLPESKRSKQTALPKPANETKKLQAPERLALPEPKKEE